MDKASSPKPASKRRTPTRPTPKPKKSRPPSQLVKVDEADVSLVSKPGRKGKGDGPGGEYWDVTVSGVRAGEVFVNVIDEQPIGRHASMQIFLNQNRQGMGVGRVAYRKAAEASSHADVYLHMRKSNDASRRAAEVAGFVDVSPAGYTQLILHRRQR